MKLIKATNTVTELVIKGELIDCGEVTISRSTPNKASRGRARYLIYLPLNRNYLWEELWIKKTRIRLFIQIIDENKEHNKNRESEFSSRF